MSSVHKLTDSEESDSSEIPLDSLKKRKRLEDDEKSSLVENEGKIKLFFKKKKRSPPFPLPPLLILLRSLTYLPRLNSK